MNKKVLIISSLFISAGILCAAQDSNSSTPPESPKVIEKPADLPSANKITAEGTISAIATDGASITLDTGKESIKFMTTKDFIDEAYMEVGDKVKISGEKTDAGTKLVDYDYVFDEAYETGEGEPEPAAKSKPAAEEAPVQAPEAATPVAPVTEPAVAPAAESNTPAASVSAPVPDASGTGSNAPQATGNATK